MMTTAPSAPATAIPPWLASLLQRQKACPREAAKLGEFLREHYFTFTGSKPAKLLAAKIADAEVVSSVLEQRLPLLPRGTGGNGQGTHGVEQQHPVPQRCRDPG